MNLNESLKWRYATKKMNGNKVSQENVNEILEAISLTASSYGLQPYKVLVVENDQLKKKLQVAAYNQSQIGDSSHLLVFAAFDTISEKNVDDLFELTASVRGVAIENFNDYKNIIKGSALQRPAEINFNWNARQAYIALGTALVAAASLKVDSTPMEGFNNAEFDSILGLTEQGLKSVVLLPLGYRDAENDYLANAPKVRKPLHDLVIHLK